MTVTEPATLLTDSLLGAFTATLAVALWRSTCRSRQVSSRYWTGAFVASALAALMGGSWHGFHESLSPWFGRLLWGATTCAVGLAGLLLLIGTLHATIGNPWRKRLVGIAVVKFLIYLVIVNRYDSYAIVIADYAPNLLAVLVFSLARLRRASFAAWSSAGIMVAFAAAAVQVSGLSLHEHFNHNDLYHVIQAISFWLLYCAGLRLIDRA